ncbi:hypothetical protein GCM10027190_61090 [Spirosoma areae]
MDEITMLLDLKRHVEQNIQLTEMELILADPKTHSDEQHPFLIKKVRMFRDALINIEHRLQELGY